MDKRSIVPIHCEIHYSTWRTRALVDHATDFNWGLRFRIKVIVVIVLSIVCTIWACVGQHHPTGGGRFWKRILREMTTKFAGGWKIITWSSFFRSKARQSTDVQAPYRAKPSRCSPKLRLSGRDPSTTISAPAAVRIQAKSYILQLAVLARVKHALLESFWQETAVGTVTQIQGNHYHCMLLRVSYCDCAHEFVESCFPNSTGTASMSMQRNKHSYFLRLCLYACCAGKRRSWYMEWFRWGPLWNWFKGIRFSDNLDYFNRFNMIDLTAVSVQYCLLSHPQSHFGTMIGILSCSRIAHL